MIIFKGKQGSIFLKQTYIKERWNEQTNKLIIIETNTQTNVINN